jgi:hypothetical protein
VADASPLMVVPLSLTAIMSIILCIYPNAFLSFLSLTRMSVQNILGLG